MRVLIVEDDDSFARTLARSNRSSSRLVEDSRRGGTEDQCSKGITSLKALTWK